MIPDVGFNAKVPQCIRTQHRIGTDEDGTQVGDTQTHPVSGRTEASGQQLFAQQKGCSDQQQRCNDHRNAGREVVAVRHGGSSSQRGEVPGQNGCAAKQRDIVVGDAPDTAQQMGNQTGKNDIVCQCAQGKVKHTDAQIIGHQNIDRVVPGHPAAVHKLHQIKGGQRGDEQKNAQQHFVP